MRTIFKMNIAIMYCLAALILSSCQEESLEEQEQPVQFSFNIEDLPVEGRVTDTEDIRAIVITVIDASGERAIEMEKFALYDVEGSFISEPIALKPGEYQLTHFMVVDEDDNVLYISPKEGSERAHLVSNPLPITFNVMEGNTNRVGVAVLRVQDGPEAYGYVSYTLSIKETVMFKVIAFEFNFFTNEEPNLVLTDAHIEVYAESPSGKKIFKGTITPEKNTFEIPDYGSKPIHIKVTKPNYHPYGKTFSRAELEAFCEDPLEVVLEREEPFRVILKSQDGLGAVYIPSGAPNKLLFTTGKGLFKVDISDIENPGDPVLIHDFQGLLGSSFREDHYGKLFLGGYFSTDMGETWQVVTGDRPTSDFVEMNGVHYGLNVKNLYRETGNDQWEFIRELPFGGRLIVYNCRLFAANGLLVSDDGVNFSETGIDTEFLGEDFDVTGVFSAFDKLYMLFVYGQSIGSILEWNGSGWMDVYNYDAENELSLDILAEGYEDYMVLVEQNSLRIFDSCSEAFCEPIYDYFFVWEPEEMPPYTISGSLLSGDYVFIETIRDDEGWNYLFAADLSKLDLK